MISWRPENGFVADFTGFLRLFANTGVTNFLSRLVIGRRCKPDQESKRIWRNPARSDVSHCIAGTRPGTRHWRTNMGEVIRFVSRTELERMRLSRESRGRNGSILPPVASVDEPREQKSELADS
jgi:hypothetical protein